MHDPLLVPSPLNNRVCKSFETIKIGHISQCHYGAAAAAVPFPSWLSSKTIIVSMETGGLNFLTFKEAAISVPRMLQLTTKV